MRTMAIALVSLIASPLYAQDWAAVQTLPAQSSVRVEEQASRGGHASGTLLAVEDAQLTLLVKNAPVAIPRDSIRRIMLRRPDPLWEGMLFGGLYGVASTAAFGDDSWTASQRAGNLLASVGLGALIDFLIRRDRQIYAAPVPRAPPAP